MKKVLFTVFIVLVTNGSLVVSQFDCPQAEEWSDCANPCNTCQQRGRCADRTFCRPGCDCQPGFFRNQRGQCVPEAQCEGSASPQCPENAIYSKCGDACVGTCDTPRPQQCTEVPECTEGCFCAPGFLKRKDGRCVRPAQCRGDDVQKPAGADQDSPQCPENAIFIKCGSPCVPTCDEPSPRACTETQQCLPGCFCIPGFLKRKDETCVRPLNCTIPKAEPPKEDPKCPPNAVFIECGSACAPTCENLAPVTGCTQDCVRACFCKPGFLKNKDGECVTLQNCTRPAVRSGTNIVPQCPANAHFHECATACPPTCENPQTISCTKQCVRGCICFPGFLKRADGKCVLPEACSSTQVIGRRLSEDPPKQECSSNEEFSSCKPACPPTCSDPNPGNCTEKCGPGCACKTGFVRNAKGNCVSSDECIIKKRHGVCPLPEEEHHHCGSTCPDTCSGLHSSDTTDCPARCVNGCFCRKGLFRTEEGKCVPKSECPTVKNDAEVTSTWEDNNQSTDNFTIVVTAAAVPSDFGCPNRKECNKACRNFGWEFGVCLGDKDEQCRCLT